MSKMKNMVILKDVNSNLVEEAIIVFKENVKIHEQNLVKKKYTSDEKKDFKNDLCVKEAETIIRDYITKMETKTNEEKLNKKIKLLKIVNVALVVIIGVLALV